MVQNKFINLKKIKNSNFLRKFLLIITSLFITNNILKVDSKTTKFIKKYTTPAYQLKTIGINYDDNLASIKWESIGGYIPQKEPIIWEKFIEGDNYPTKYKRGEFIKKEIKSFTISSLNRSIVFNNKIIGPDISWLVPPGLKWTETYKYDFSIRGNSGLEENNKFLSWNDGDAVAQIYYQILNHEKTSFGFNLGVRSVQQNPNLSGGQTAMGEGISAGFRYDHKISDLSGFAIGGEQILHFDGLTDTGRDFYITATKAWNSKNKDFPLYLITGGLATGKMAEGNIKGLCTNLFGGSGTELAHQRSLCWAPVFTLSKVYNKYFSNFVEYNSKHFLLGTSLAPFDQIPLRGTFAVVLSDHIDNYKIHEFNEMSSVFRVSLGF